MKNLQDNSKFIENLNQTQQQINQFKQTVNFAEKVENRIRDYIITIFETTLFLYIVLFILILIEPINVKSYYPFFAHMAGVFLLNLIHST